MNFLLPNLAPAYPEIFLLVMVCVVLLADLMAGEKMHYVTYLLAQIALFGCALITFIASVPEVIYTFSGMFVDDTLADVLKMMVYITVSIFLVYSHKYIDMRGMFSGEFFIMLLKKLFEKLDTFGFLPGINIVKPKQHGYTQIIMRAIRLHLFKIGQFGMKAFYRFIRCVCTG